MRSQMGFVSRGGVAFFFSVWFLFGRGMRLGQEADVELAASNDLAIILSNVYRKTWLCNKFILSIPLSIIIFICYTKMTYLFILFPR